MDPSEVILPGDVYISKHFSTVQIVVVLSTRPRREDEYGHEHTKTRHANTLQIGDSFNVFEDQILDFVLAGDMWERIR